MTIPGMTEPQTLSEALALLRYLRTDRDTLVAQNARLTAIIAEQQRAIADAAEILDEVAGDLGEAAEESRRIAGVLEGLVS